MTAAPKRPVTAGAANRVVVAVVTPRAEVVVRIRGRVAMAGAARAKARIKILYILVSVSFQTTS
jgi:hypothetical protein